MEVDVHVRVTSRWSCVLLVVVVRGTDVIGQDGCAQAEQLGEVRGRGQGSQRVHF